MTFPWRIEAFNSPFGDPGFLFANPHTGQGLIFDLGDPHRLSPRQLLRADRIFISHGHIDHLIGFDHLLRLNLNRPRHLHFYGPPGIIELLGHKLRGYSWNLTAHYELLITVYEITEQNLSRQHFACRHKFQPETTMEATLSNGIDPRKSGYRVATVCLDHGGLPCLALCLEEELRINFLPDRLTRCGWTPGPWLTRVRKALLAGDAPTTQFRINNHDFTLQEITRRIVLIQPGRRIAYVTDIGFTPDNLQKLLPLITDADLLLCEAAFLEETADKAAITHHLTAGQAGQLATLARAKKLRLFHFSPRHSGREDDFRQQASQYYNGPVTC